MPPRIKDDILDCIVYLYADEAAARSGEEKGGTGFIVGRPFLASGKDHVITWLVTNRHVIERGGWSVRINTSDGGFDVIDTDDRQWLFHPDGHDIAVRPVSLGSGKFKFGYLTTDWFLSEATLNDLAIGPGDPCHVVGRFVSHAGKKRNIPTVRYGQIAQMPIEKVKCEGEEHECFLVEIRSLGGYSGSPVFVYLDTAFYRPIKAGKTHDGKIIGPGHFDPGPWLLGVDWCMVPSWDPVCDKDGTELQSGWIVEGNTGMAGVIPAWHLHWLLMNDPRVVQISKDLEENILKELKRPGPPAVVKTGTKAPRRRPKDEEASNHDHREDFNRLLGAAVKPPKSSD